MKKKINPNSRMTVPEMIKVLQDFQTGHTIQYSYYENDEDIEWDWYDDTSPDWDFVNKRFQTKPAPKIIPFTADDWRLFEGRLVVNINAERPIEIIIDSWDKNCLNLQDGSRVPFINSHKELMFINPNQIFGKKEVNK